MSGEPRLPDRAPTPPLREVARVRVIYGDTDQMGMVYYANYLRYFEIARNELLRGAGASYRAFEQTHGLLLPVVSAHVDYRRPAHYDDDLIVRASVSRAGPASARFDYALARASDGEELATGHTIHACITRAGKVVRIPAELTGVLGIDG